MIYNLRRLFKSSFLIVQNEDFVSFGVAKNFSSSACGHPGTELCKKLDELAMELMTWHATVILQQEIASQDILWLILKKCTWNGSVSHTLNHCPPLKTTFRKKGKSSHFITSITGHTTVHYSFRQLEYSEQTMWTMIIIIIIKRKFVPGQLRGIEHCMKYTKGKKTKHHIYNFGAQKALHYRKTNNF